jgi:hypothetical protein
VSHIRVCECPSMDSTRLRVVSKDVGVDVKVAGE